MIDVGREDRGEQPPTGGGSGTSGGARKRRNIAVRTRVVVVAAGLGLLVAGCWGSFAYARSYWIYRGYPPPVQPGFTYTVGRRGRVPRRVQVRSGQVEKINVWSPSLGGRWISCDVFLPPGYWERPLRRYPVFYFLHGLHTQGFTYLTVLGGAVDENVLIAQLRMKPMIVVIPEGPWKLDTEWSNTPVAGAWDTFVSKDLVDGIDGRLRTIRAGEGRAIGGVSEGGYGALNIGLHHPNEFSVIESWSGYSLADPTSGVFGTSRALLNYNSPLYVLPSVAHSLRIHHVYIWFFIGNDDQFFRQNVQFAAELNQLHLPHEFFWVVGGHLWRPWRKEMGRALLAASDHVMAPVRA
jgi:enterochelin esterase-like enzyme